MLLFCRLFSISAMSYIKPENMVGLSKYSKNHAFSGAFCVPHDVMQTIRRVVPVASIALHIMPVASEYKVVRFQGDEPCIPRHDITASGLNASNALLTACGLNTSQRIISGFLSKHDSLEMFLATAATVCP